LNQKILFETYGYSLDSTYIDLNSLGIDSIEPSTFHGLYQLEVLHLQNNKLKQIDKDLFKDLIQLRELSLESNVLVAIDKNSFINLNNLKLVCLNNNPIASLFPTDLLTFICTNHINCTVSLADKFIRNYTLKKLDKFIQDKNATDLEKQDENLFHLIESQISNNNKLYEIIVRQQNKLDKLLEINENQTEILFKLEKIIYFQNYILASNIEINDLLNQGFKIVYDQFYSHNTTYSELLAVKLQCNSNSIICVGGADTGSSNTLLLVSCGSCLDILTNTTANQPRFVNGAWWYFTNGLSFGFAPNSNIKQSYADVFDCDSNNMNCIDSKRLSYQLHGGAGWRIGNIYSFIPSPYRAEPSRSVTVTVTVQAQI